MLLIYHLGFSSLSCKFWMGTVGYVFKWIEGRILQDELQSCSLAKKAQAVSDVCQMPFGQLVVANQPCRAAGCVLRMLRRHLSDVFHVPHSAEVCK